MHYKFSGPNESGNKSSSVDVFICPSTLHIWILTSSAANSLSLCLHPPQGEHSKSPEPITTTSLILVKPFATRLPIALASAHCDWG